MGNLPLNAAPKICFLGQSFFPCLTEETFNTGLYILAILLSHKEWENLPGLSGVCSKEWIPPPLIIIMWNM